MLSDYQNYRAAPGFITLEKKRPEHVQRVVATHFGIQERDLFRKCRKLKIVKPRQILQKLLYSECGMTQEAIGSLFGQHHSTIINSITVINNLVSVNDYIKNDFDLIKEKLFITQ